VCSWSLKPQSPAELIAAMKRLSIDGVQLALSPIAHELAARAWRDSIAQLRDAGIDILSGMMATRGEDYSTLQSIARTGGVRPDEHWEANLAHAKAVAEIAARSKIALVTFHAGFLPHKASDPAFPKLLKRITLIAGLFAAKGIELGFETGQEEAETLRGFLEKLNQPNVGVNFDPANMILYDKGDPIAALRVLGPWLKQCHIKDAVKTRTPGTWGEEVVAGTGQVDWRAFFQTLDELRFQGSFAIEREAGERRVAEIQAARQLVEKVIA
jgi:L-ribulose-5-phosphate 3-epimerase